MGKLADSGQVNRRGFLQSAGLAIGGAAVGAGIGFGTARAVDDDDSTQPGTGGGEPIKVGSVFPLTGAYAGDGKAMEQGATLAIEELNDAGGLLGRQINHVVLDAGDFAPERVAANFERLINQDDVSAILNGFILVTGPEYDIVAQAQIPYLHLNAQAVDTEKYLSDTDKYGTSFMCGPSEQGYSTSLAALLEGLVSEGTWEPATRNLAIIQSDFSFSINVADGLRDALSDSEWNVVVEEQYKSPLSQWGPIISKVRDTNPAAVAFTSPIPQDQATFLRQYTDRGDTLVYGQFAPSVPGFYDLVGEAGDGVVWAVNAGVLPDPIGDEFTKKYTERWDESPGFSFGGVVYDIFNMWANAVGLSGNERDGERIAGVLEKTTLRGVAGGYHFTDEHAVAPYPADVPDPSLGLPNLFFQIQPGGESRIISPDPYTQTPFRVQFT